jgi:hypothetical protein
MKCGNKSALGEIVVSLTNTGTQGHFIQNSDQASYSALLFFRQTQILMPGRDINRSHSLVSPTLLD